MNKSINVGVFNPTLIHQASPYCGDQVFAKGFEQNGYEVTRVDYRAIRNPDQFLLETAEEVKPDLFWFGKCERINPETIRVLKMRFPNSIFCKWAADVRDEPYSLDLEHMKYMDMFFGTFGGEYLKKFLLPNVKGVCSIFTFTDSDYYKKYGVSKNFEADVLWTGRKGFGDNPLRNEIIDYLLYTNIQNVNVIGLNEWIGDPEYLYAINSAKIGIGSNSFNRRKYSSDRIGNYMACGTFFLTQYIEGIEECFQRGIHLDWFETVKEMEEKIKYYLIHDEERKEIAKKGQEFVLSHFDCKPLVENILNVIKTGKSNYPWDDVYLNKSYDI